MSLDPGIAQRITHAVDAGFDAQLDFTRALVRHASLRTREGSAQDLLEAAYRERGLHVDRWDLDPAVLAAHEGAGAIDVPYDGVSAIVATFEPVAAAGRSLILNGHVDVVPEGPAEGWSRDPFDAQIIDGWLYGRGAGDMKAGLVANLFALDALRAAGLEPTGRIHVESVPEEESTGNGSLAAFLRGYTADAVIIPEPEDEMLVRANVGVLWFDVRVAGSPTHPREMASGFNAIDAAIGVLQRLRELEQRWNDERGDHRHFEDLDHPINLNLGGIHGGDWRSSVPAWCELQLRLALYPGVSAPDAWAQVEALLAEITHDDAGNPIHATARRTGFFSEGYVLEEGSDAERVLQDAHRSAVGDELRSFTTPGYLDGRVFALYADTPCLVYGPVSEAIHGYDERVDVESIRRITTAIALFVAEWCGVRDLPNTPTEPS